VRIGIDHHLLLFMTRLLRFAAAGLLLTGSLLTACNPNHDTDQISTESATTRHSTHPEPDSSGYAADSTQD
jgi:ABC-type oligopeptide transport system substrate-binding subunit